jgi:WD40 repeat protein
MCRAAIVVASLFLALLVAGFLVKDPGESAPSDWGPPPVILRPSRWLGHKLHGPSFGNSYTSVAFAPDGRAVASSWFDGEKAVFTLAEVATGRELWRIEECSLWNSAIAYSPDGRTMAIGVEAGIKFLDTETGAIRTVLKRTNSGELGQLLFSPDGRKLLGSEFLALKVWESTSGREVESFEVRTRELNGIAVSPDGRMFAGAGMGPVVCRSVGLFGLGGIGCGPEGGRIWLWKSGSIGEPRVFKTRSNANAVAFTPDGRTLASGSFDGVKLWNLADGKGRKIFDGPALALAYSPDGRALAIGTVKAFDDGEVGEIHLWDVASRRIRSTLRGDVGAIHSVAFAPNGRVLAGGGERGASLWDLPAELPSD